MMAQALRLLIIDDSEEDALLVAQELRKGGFDPAFTRVETPHELAVALDSGPWDAVILDYNMPKFNGLDALRTVQAREPSLPFILVSEVVGEEQAVEAIKAGAHDFILKGRLTLLAPALTRELREAAVRRERRRVEEELLRCRDHLEECVRERTAQLEQLNRGLAATNEASLAEIGKREQAETTMRETEQKLRNILEHSTNLFYMHGTDHVFTYMSPQTRHFFDCEPEEAMGRWMEFITDNPVNRVAIEATQRAIDTGERQPPYMVESIGRKGRIIWVEVNESPIVKDGRTVAIVGSLTDITERKKAEEALRESEQRFASFMLHMPAATWMKDLQGRYVYANAEAERVFSMSLTALLGKTDNDIFPPETARQFGENDCRVLAEGGSLQTTEVLNQADGLEHHSIVSKFAVNGPDGKPAYIAGVAFDITERKLAEDEIRRLNSELAARAAELEAANRELEAFNYTVAHDLRKPLTVVNGYCQALDELCGDQLDVHCKEYLQEAYDGTMRMNRLIDALLNFSNLSHVEPQREVVDLSGMAQAVAAELESAEPERRVMFRIAEGIVLDGDPNLLHVLFDNLLGNAWKFTAAKEEAVIEFGVTEIDGKPACFVRDNGAGFAMADVDKIFLPFQRLPGSEGFRGHGIGLATVERIVRRHGGRVWAEGQPGKGATFYFTLNGERTI